MNRREALRQAGLFAGAAALWASLPARTWAALALPPGWTGEDETLLTLVGDTIIPATASSPGAGAVAIGRFMLVQAADCYAPGASDTLRRGLKEIQTLSQQQFTKTFADLTVAQREKLLTDYEAAPSMAKGGAAHPFRLLKELTLLGYFTSEAGATQALRYLPIPGSYQGSIPLGKDDRSWAL